MCDTLIMKPCSVVIHTTFNFWFSVFRDKIVNCLARLFMFSLTLEEIFLSRIKPMRRCVSLK